MIRRKYKIKTEYQIMHKYLSILLLDIDATYKHKTNRERNFSDKKKLEQRYINIS